MQQTRTLIKKRISLVVWEAEKSKRVLLAVSSQVEALRVKKADW